MENGAFSAGPADSAPSAASETTPQSPPQPPLEMKTIRLTTEEKQPLCQCDTHCSCLEAGVQPAGRDPSVRVKTWSHAKTVVMAVGMVALVVWCGVMAAMYHYGIL